MKIAIIGAGQVGATTAHRIAEKGLGDIVLMDIVDSVKGKALDLLESAPIECHDCSIIGSTDYEEIKGANIVIITAGLPRQPGMSREDLLKKNKEIVKQAAENIKKFAPNSIVIVVTNPLDVMSYIVLKTTGFEPSKVMGMAGILDSARFRTFIAEELDVSKRDIHALVLGSHGDSMVPIPEYTTVSGIPVTELLSKKKIDELIKRTRDGGAEIVNYLKTGSAYYAPSAAIVEMVEAIVTDSKRIFPVSAYLNGEYGYKDLYIGVPAKLGSGGIENIYELKLSKDVKEQLDKSAQAIKGSIKEALK